MKVNCSNKILSFSTFNSLAEAETFFKNQESTQKLFLSETFGDNSCVVKCINSLSGVVEFCLGFSSETRIDELTLMAKHESDRWIVQIDNNLFFVKPSTSELIGKSDILTPLIGLYAKGDKVLALEEAGLKVLDLDSTVLQEKTIDLIDSFELKNGILSVSTMDGEQEEISLAI
jgi:hypothetical protein